MGKMNWKKVIGWGMTALVVISVVGFNAYNNKKDLHDEQLSIAMNLPMTGLMSAYGIPYANGVKMGIQDELKENNIPLSSLKIDMGDNQSKTAEAVTLLQRQQFNGFNVYVSGLSDASRASAAILDSTEIPHFFVAFDMDGILANSNRIRILPNANLEIPAFIKFIEQKKPKKAFIISYNNKSIQSFVYKGLKPYLDQNGIDYQIEKLDTNFSDFRILALKVKEFNPDVILINHYDFGLIKIIPTLKEQNLIQNNNTYVCLDMIELVNTHTDLSITKDIIYSNTFFNIHPNQNFISNYKKEFGKEPTYFSAYGYDAGRLVAKVWIRDEKVSKEAIIKQTPYQGVSGVIELNSHGDLTSVLFSGTLDKDGKVIEWKP